ncbi:MAG TPA: cytochrome c [Thermomicrobiales bacterium]|jgi:mono/diheme cytochrome c family protein|nr:cytochrome c [Thermomicrobiales bacterium]
MPESRRPVPVGAGVNLRVATRRPLRSRAALLSCLLAVAMLAVACGRASEDDINSALGITPTPTRNAEQIAQATTAAADQATREAAAAAGTPASGEDAALAALSGGNVALGNTAFIQSCLSCHGPNAPAGALNGPNDADLSPESFLALVREGTGHPVPPGAIPESRLSDAALRNLYAWLLSVSGQG